MQFGLPAIASLNNSLASYQSVATIIMCVMNALTWREVGVKIFWVCFVRQWLNPPF